MERAIGPGRTTGLEELHLLLQADTLDEAADWALEHGLSIAVVKLGADGALVAQNVWHHRRERGVSALYEMSMDASPVIA